MDRETLQPDLNYGFGSQTSKSRRRRVPRETRAPLEVFSDQSAASDSSINLLTRSKDL